MGEVAVVYGSKTTVLKDVSETFKKIYDEYEF